MLTQKSLREFLAALASPAPTPGGGSASALASASGTALLVMVASLPKTREGIDDDRRALATAALALTGVLHQLTEAVDDDATAYGQVVDAFKLPKSTQVEKDARQSAVQRAMRRATDVPLDVMRLSVAALKQAEAVASHGHRAASSDVAAAIALLRAGFAGAAANVRANAAALRQDPFAIAAGDETARLEAAAAAAADGAERSLPGR